MADGSKVLTAQTLPCTLTTSSLSLMVATSSKLFKRNLNDPDAAYDALQARLTAVPALCAEQMGE
jgi:hypothetical protein